MFRSLKKMAAMLTAMVLMMVMYPIQIAAAEDPQVVDKEVPIYYFTSNITGTLAVAFFNGNMDIPYCSGETAAILLRNYAAMTGDAGYSIESGYTTYQTLIDANMVSIGSEKDPEDEIFYILRENGSFVLFDYADNMIWFSDRDRFRVSSYAVSGGDLVAADGYFYTQDNSIAWNDEDDRAVTNLYRRVNSTSFKRDGDVTTILLSDYNFNIELYNGNYYLPLATISDIVLPFPLTFNGEAAFMMIDGPENNTVNEDGLTQKDLYYMTEAGDRSQALADFTYNELCLMLDNSYGLQAEHGITNGFNEYFIATGLEYDLCSTNNAVFTNALYQLLTGYFGDQHSSLTAVSPYTGGNVDIEGGNRSISLAESQQMYDRFVKAREAAGITVNGQILDGYTEIGDTAFITFDSFISASQNYYDQNLWDNFSDIYMSDTISLVVYAHMMIHRNDSPIRKVVIDLSCNGGGSLDACVFIASWVLGSANLSIEDVNTGAEYTTVYWVDTDLDGKCTTDDELGVDYLDVYCLVNGNSFSCGNLLPTLFKEDGRVTLIGQTTGGGACVVRKTSAADGTVFNISDYYRLSIVKNGSFYTIDRGVEADIPLRKPASFYDREALVEYLDTIR